MDTIEDLFRAFGGPSKVGQAIGVSTEHAAGMKRRESIPVNYWPDLIDDARDRQIDGISYESLTLLHSRREPAQPETNDDASPLSPNPSPQETVGAV